MPIICIHCNISLSKSQVKHKNKFCSHSCCASHNNKGVRRHGKSHFCLQCNTQIKTGKYCSNKCQGIYVRNLKVISGTATSVTLKKYLLETQGHHCWKCNNSTWNDQPIPLEIEHIDGHSENNSLENLSILCPNCHAQTLTYKNRNFGNGRHARRQRYANGQSY